MQELEALIAEKEKAIKKLGDVGKQHAKGKELMKTLEESKSELEKIQRTRNKRLRDDTMCKVGDDTM